VKKTDQFEIGNSTCELSISKAHTERQSELK